MSFGRSTSPAARTDNKVRGEINQIPVVYAVVSANIKYVQFLQPFSGAFLSLGALAHDTHRASPNFVDRTFHQLLDLIDRHLAELFAELEDAAHSNADEIIVLRLIIGIELEVSSVFA
jgi:hypothetical protein